MKITLVTEEQEILKNYFKTTTITLIRNKSQAITMYSLGLEENQIASSLFISIRTIQRWIQDFIEKRISSIFCGYVNNENANKLTKEQKNQIKEILQKPPTEYGLPKEFWDVPQLKKYVEARFGIVYESDESYHFLLKFSNLSFKYPDTFSIRRDESAIEKRMEELRKEVQPYLENPEWEVFTADETRIVLEAITRKAWLPKGKRTIIKVNQTNEYQSYFGALNQKNFKCHAFELSWQNQEEIINALKKLMTEFPNKKICIIWDNAKFHKGQLIREALSSEEFRGKIHLMNFPPYAPDYNPIEHVWNTVKAELSNKQFDSFEITKQMFIDKLSERLFHYKL